VVFLFSDLTCFRTRKEERTNETTAWQATEMGLELYVYPRSADPFKER